MTTSIALMVMVVFFVAGGLMLRGSKVKRLGRGQKIVLSAVMGILIVFFVWLAIMVFVVGPAMRSM